jgi:hypothetical protein
VGFGALQSRRRSIEQCRLHDQPDWSLQCSFEAQSLLIFWLIEKARAGLEAALHYVAMRMLLYVPILLSLVVLGAHFLRDANHIGVVIASGLIGLLFVKRPGAARVVQAALVLGALEWVWTIYDLVQFRTAMGMPATRMMIILGIVAAVTALSAGLFQTRALKRVYGLP